MKIRAAALALAALAILAVSQTASADEVTLQFQGFTDGNSSFDGTAFTPGTPFDIDVEFESSLFISPFQGFALYPFIYDVQAEVGGTSYLVAPLNIDDEYGVEFLDASNTGDPGIYATFFGVLSGPDDGLAFIAAFANASPGWSATDPTTTTFSGYSESLGDELAFSTPGGPLFIDYDANGADLDGGISASIIAPTPEPSAFSLAFLGLGVIAFICRRKFAVLGRS